MADLDTESKRRSGLRFRKPWVGILPKPDGTISQADRQHAIFSYSGILAAAATTISGFISLYEERLQSPTFGTQRLQSASFTGERLQSPDITTPTTLGQ